MLGEERKSEIRNLLRQKGIIEVSMLAELFSASRETIRRDLNDLEQQGVLRRTHGGAMLMNFGAAAQSPVIERHILQMEEKKRICKRAAAYIVSNDTLFIDTSSTLVYLPWYISPDIYLTIITNSINFLYEVSKINNNNWILICLGGILDRRNLSVLGNGTLKNAESYYPTKTLISCAGISPINKITDFSPHEVEVKRMMIDRAQEVFLLADHTKFEKTGNISLCDFSALDHLVTDYVPPEFDGDLISRLNIVADDPSVPV